MGLFKTNRKSNKFILHCFGPPPKKSSLLPHEQHVSQFIKYLACVMLGSNQNLYLPRGFLGGKKTEWEIFLAFAKTNSMISSSISLQQLLWKESWSWPYLLIRLKWNHFILWGGNFRFISLKKKKAAGNVSEINVKLHTLCAEYKELTTAMTIDIPENNQSPHWILLLGYQRFDFYLCQR